MNLHTYQDAVMGGSLDEKMDDEERLITTALGIAGEAGEIADLLKKARHKGVGFDIDEMRDELGDLLWYLTRMCGLFDVSLDELAELNMRKLAVRHPTFYGYLFGGSGWSAPGVQDHRVDHPGPGVTNADLGRLGPVRSEYQ